jgi:hypothetical protein
MIEDVDGLRIYSSTACEFMQKVAGKSPLILFEMRVDERCE